MPIRVVQWATGHSGMRSLAEILRRPELELVGLYVYDPAKVGRDAGEIAGGAKLGITATNRIEDILDLKADCVIYMAHVELPMHRHDENVRRLLRSGKNVVALTGYYWPWTHGEPFAESFEAAGREGNATLFGTGFSPGFMTERLGATMTEACNYVHSLTYVEICDCSRASPSKIIQTIGGSKKPEDALMDSYTTEMTSYYHYEALDALAYALGISLTRKETQLELGLATRDSVTQSGLEVPLGTVGATTRRWIGWLEDRPFLTFESRWMVVDDIPGYEPDQRWSLTVEGRPAMKIELTLGQSFSNAIDWDLTPSPVNEAIAAPTLNAIPRVCAAPPGILRAHPFTTWRQQPIR